MVASRIVPQIVYRESKTIDPEDNGMESNVYQLNVLGASVAVLLGKPKYLFADKGTIYVPIYVISGNEIRAQMGVFELESMKIVSLYKEGEIDVSRLTEPLLYTFVTPAFLAQTESDPSQYAAARHVADAAMTDLALKTLSNVMEEVKEIEKDEDDLFRLQLPTEQISAEKQSANEMIHEGIFTVDRKAPALPLLAEESAEDAKRYKDEYVQSTRNTWIENYMKNNQYRILENEGNGDCLFACIRDAYKHLGKYTTVDKLRAILADEMTDDVFMEQRNLFLQFESEIKETKQEMGTIRKTIRELRTRVDKNTDNSENNKRLLGEATELAAQHKKLEKHVTETQANQTAYTGYMKDIDSLDKMRAYVRTSSYWADTWSISTLERVLNVKLILMSEEAYVDKALDSVLNCGEINRELQERKQFHPDHFILVTLNHQHYRLVTYKAKPILTFSEVPFDVKMLILNKCLEKMAGPYSIIQDFRNFKSKFGIDPDEGKPPNYENEVGEGDLYESDVALIFYESASSTAKPGKADGEKIPKAKVTTFESLAKIRDWRKQLADEWIDTPLQIDRHRWASVQHYLEGAKYKKGYPDIYLQFSLDSESELSKDVKKAKAHKGLLAVAEAIDKKTKAPKAPKVDLDYHLGRDMEERELALRAKFANNATMRAVLKETHMALLLKKEKRGTPPVPDTLLMKIRKEL